MHLSKLCGFAAIAALASATVAMAAATPVNIADPNGRLARVEPGSRLAVQEVPPSSFFHSLGHNVPFTGSCVQIATPPAGKALVVRQIRAEIDQGTGAALAIWSDSQCTLQVGYWSTGGHALITFDPGFAVASGAGLWAQTYSGVAALAFVDGYTVPSSVAPVGAQTIESGGTRHRFR